MYFSVLKCPIVTCNMVYFNMVYFIPEGKPSHMLMICIVFFYSLIVCRVLSRFFINRPDDVR